MPLFDASKNVALRASSVGAAVVAGNCLVVGAFVVPGGAPEYGPVWAGDQRQKLFRNLETLPGEILLSAVTAPGAGLLPWDTQQCAALGEHRHSGKLGCHVSRVAARGWNESAADRGGAYTDGPIRMRSNV
jgi:hypothetical protein